MFVMSKPVFVFQGGKNYLHFSVAKSFHYNFHESLKINRFSKLMKVLSLLLLCCLIKLLLGIYSF